MSGIIAQNSGRHTGLVKAAAGGGGVWTHITTITSDGSDTTLDLVNGSNNVVIDGTYDEYMFCLNNIHPETNAQYPQFNFSEDTGSNYNVTKTSTTYSAYSKETSGDSALEHEAWASYGQETGFIPFLGIVSGSSGAADSTSGWLHLFNPASTTFVKPWTFVTDTVGNSAYQVTSFFQGYCNTTSAVDAVRFQYASGEIQAGTIALYGLG